MRLAITALTDELRRLKAAGVSAVPVSHGALEALRRAVALEGSERPREVPAPVAVAAPKVRMDAPPPQVVLPEGGKSERWAALCRQVAADPVCASKVREGRKPVVGVGTLDASIVFVGEAPGAEEEIQGEPFVGPAGQLLTKMILGMGLARSDVYIGNIMNWRPDLPTGPNGVQTGNRPPTEAEINHCLPYLMAQIEIVNPRLLVALGATAAKGLLGFQAFGALGEVRGRWHDFKGRPLMVTYHPSYILRNPTNKMKRLIWEDLLKVMERGGLPISQKQQNFFL